MTLIRFTATVGLVLTAACASTPDARSPVTVPLQTPFEPLDVLRLRLADADPAKRAGAAWELAGAKSVSDETLEILTRLRDDDERSVRHAAAWALGHLLPKGAPDEFETAPRLLSPVKPRYPDAAFKARIQGTVIVEVLIGEDGGVVYARVLTSILGLDAAALDTVRQWRFQPARRAGKPVAIYAQAPVEFRIF